MQGSQNSNSLGKSVVNEQSIVAVGAEKYNENPVVQALLHLLPFWSSADTLLKARALEMHKDRLFIFFDELGSGRQELTEDLISTNDFLHAYFSTVKAVWGTRRKEKIKRLARLLKSELVTKQSDDNAETFEEMLEILDALGDREFRILLLLKDYETRYSERQAESELARIILYWSEFQCEAKQILPNKSSYDAFMARLERTGCYLRITGTYLDNTGGYGKTTYLFRQLCELISEQYVNEPNLDT